MILGIETSCDETAAAVVTHDGVVRSNIISSQAELHAPYGGVVPEVASRRHLELVVPVVERALAAAGVSLADLDAVAVTEGPGLIGALLVGLSAAKAIAFARRLPLVPVNHLHGHLAALYLEPEPLEPPFLALLASGGHTMILEVTDRRGYRCIGQTLDDAAGEAFDKGARLLGLGYPGGAQLELLAAEGDPGGAQRSRPGCWASPATTCRSAGSRPRCATRSPVTPARPGPTWRPPTRRRSSGRWSSAPPRPSPTRAPRRSRSSAASPATARCARRSRAAATSSACGWRWSRRSSAPTTPR